MSQYLSFFRCLFYYTFQKKSCPLTTARHRPPPQLTHSSQTIQFHHIFPQKIIARVNIQTNTILIIKGVAHGITWQTSKNTYVKRDALPLLTMKKKADYQANLILPLIFVLSTLLISGFMASQQPIHAALGLLILLLGFPLYYFSVNKRRER